SRVTPIDNCFPRSLRSNSAFDVDVVTDKPLIDSEFLRSDVRNDDDVKFVVEFEVTKSGDSTGSS
ncbi:unnamed protein product, partial [Schistosoma curassoni]|uniref:Coat protein n=1 Tax=Schistosoma curassoni TaxID=6186 RepID=A0A183JLG1_9TREM